ncbi:BadF/BadG/BcrA/BcrD ATPase family protein [Nonomuraea roseoviolacea subsp. roseoviolacea]|uniref:N-acetylglucosamine kinase n=1 Tax=Nonomuraea roseoviolacea TaxID=103837 RepID=UPI0031E04DCA
MRLVLGIDAGGTSSRAALHTLTGDRVGHGISGGGNPVTLSPDTAHANLTEAIRQALGHLDPSMVLSCCAGLAGTPELTSATVRRALAHCGLTPAPTATTSIGDIPVITVGDVVTAFAAGTCEPSGSILISGTGAIAAKITNRRQAATADGYGWLLGDDGSAFWLGRAAARATLDALTQATHFQAHPPAPRPFRETTPSDTPTDALQSAPDRRPGSGPDALQDQGLVGSVLRRLVPGGLHGDPVAEVVTAVHERPPLALAELAPLVSAAAAAGDPTATAIVAEAARRLAATLTTVHEPGRPAVLSGSVLTAEGPIRQAVRDLLPDAVTAGDAAGAAAWLAARPLLNQHESRARHPRFVNPETCPTA